MVLTHLVSQQMKTRQAKLPPGSFEVFEIYRDSRGSSFQYHLYGYFKLPKEEIDKKLEALNKNVFKYDRNRFKARRRAAMTIEGKTYILNLNPVTLKEENGHQENLHS